MHVVQDDLHRGLAADIAEERRQPNGRAAVEASSRLLGELVAQHAPSYEEFVWSVIGEEDL